jgi:hypothetical protein
MTGRCAAAGVADAATAVPEAMGAGPRMIWKAPGWSVVILVRRLPLVSIV